MAINHGEEVVAGLFLDRIDIYGFPKDAETINVNGAAIPSTDWAFDAAATVLTIRIHVPLADALNIKIFYDTTGPRLAHPRLRRREQ